MKVWTKVKIEQKNKDVERLIQAYTNYIFKDTSLSKLKAKYQISQEEINTVYQELASRLGGLLILYIGQDQRRLHDIVNRYQSANASFSNQAPEVEGYIEK